VCGRACSHNKSTTYSKIPASIKHESDKNNFAPLCKLEFATQKFAV